MADSVESILVSRLDTLIKLQALSLVGGYNSQGEKVEFLSKVGMKPKEIGELLGVSANSVSAALLRLKKKGATAGKTGAAEAEE